MVRSRGLQCQSVTKDDSSVNLPYSFEGDVHRVG